jgi:4-hydroxybenzoate polyprenyltransferase
MVVIYALLHVLLGLLFIDYPIFSTKSLLSFSIAGLGMAAIYSFNYITDVEEDKINTNKSPLTRGELTVRELTVFSFSLFTISIMASFVAGPTVFVFMILIFIISFIYSYPLFRGFRYRRFKEVPFLKTSIISGVWGLLFLIPIFATDTILTFGAILFVIFLMIQTFIDSTISDIRDIPEDSMQGIKTIPILLKDNTNGFLYSLNTISIFSLLYGFYYKIFPVYFSIFYIQILIQYYTLYSIKDTKSLKQVYTKIRPFGLIILYILLIYLKYII